jgi:hypothetical protein
VTTLVISQNSYSKEGRGDTPPLLPLLSLSLYRSGITNGVSNVCCWLDPFLFQELWDSLGVLWSSMCEQITTFVLFLLPFCTRECASWWAVLPLKQFLRKNPELARRALTRQFGKKSGLLPTSLAEPATKGTFLGINSRFLAFKSQGNSQNSTRVPSSVATHITNGGMPEHQD